MSMAIPCPKCGYGGFTMPLESVPATNDWTKLEVWTVGWPNEWATISIPQIGDVHPKHRKPDLSFAGTQKAIRRITLNAMYPAWLARTIK